MMRFHVIGLVAAGLLAGCGGSGGVTCDEGPYLAATSVPRVQAPEGLDSLDPLNEMPLPEASPREPRPEGGPCLERPPTVIIME